MGEEQAWGPCPLVVRLALMCGRLQVVKGFVTSQRAGRGSHVFGLLMRLTRPLAIMPSADQVPINSTHSRMHEGIWVS